jgi:hypothetical protein
LSAPYPYALQTVPYAGSYWNRGNQTTGNADSEINAAIQDVINTASQEWSPIQFEGEYPKTGFGITVLRQKDLAVTNQAAAAIQSSVSTSIAWGPLSVTTASAWEEWINLNIDNRIYVVITGVWYADANFNVKAIRFKANGEDCPVMDIEEMQTYDIPFMWLEKPIAVKPGNNVTVRYAALAVAAAPVNIGLLGYTLAKRAYLIIE